MRNDMQPKAKRNIRLKTPVKRMKKSGRTTVKQRKIRRSSRRRSHSNKSSGSVKRKRRLGKLFVGELSGMIRLASVILVLLISISALFYSVKRVSGYGMLPTLRDKDVVVVKRYDSIERFDLVWVANGNEAGFRRVVGLPGEQVVIEDDRLKVDNQEMDEKYLIDKINDYQATGKTFTSDFSISELVDNQKIPEDYYFVLGDNRPYTTDSREYGLVTKETIKGKVVLRLLPLEQARYF